MARKACASLEGKMMARTFATQDDAKEFLIAKIVTQAQREKVVLSDAERKMLYYTVERRTVGDDVADEFPEGNVTINYERKIGSLIHDAFRQDEADRGDYISAFNELEKGANYLVMFTGNTLKPFSQSFLTRFLWTNPAPVRERGFLDQLWLFLTGLGAAIVGLVVAFGWQSWKESFWHWFDLHFKH